MITKLPKRKLNSGKECHIGKVIRRVRGSVTVASPENEKVTVAIEASRFKDPSTKNLQFSSIDDTGYQIDRFSYTIGSLIAFDETGYPLENVSVFRKQFFG